MENREVIFVSNALANGGAARVLCILANRFAAEGLRVGVFAFTPYKGECDLDLQVTKEYGPSGNDVTAKIKRLRQLRRIARANPNATLIAFEYFVNMQTLVACKGLKNRVIVSERNDPARVGARFPINSMREILYRSAHTVVCQTDDAAAHFTNRVRKQVILNPIKPDLPDPFTGKRRQTIITFCRLEKQKNLEMLIEAFGKFHEQYPGYNLEIYGDGSERTALEVLVDSLELEGSVSIFPARSDIHHVVRDCALFVLPSNYEGLSNSMLEALALGLPSICTDCPCGGARTVIANGENGILIPVGDGQALLEAMSKLVGNETLADQLSRNGYRIRETLSLDSIAAQWRRLLPGDEALEISSKRNSQ